jgi:hypothetical protein
MIIDSESDKSLLLSIISNCLMPNGSTYSSVVQIMEKIRELEKKVIEAQIQEKTNKEQ